MPQSSDGCVKEKLKAARFPAFHLSLVYKGSHRNARNALYAVLIFSNLKISPICLHISVDSVVFSHEF